MSSTGPEQASAKPETKSATPVLAPVAPVPVLPPLPDPGLLGRVSIPFQAVDHALRGYHLDATVQPDQIISAAEELDREGFALDTVTGVDWIAASQMEVVYDYFHPANGLRVVVRCRLPRENPEVATISHIFPGANWHERETHDFFGIRFLGHPNLTAFLLPEDATYHPLRKDFVA
jgi:NADH-quinone oxidoreductase subunit C